MNPPNADYYQVFAAEYFRQTLNVDMTPLYAPFLARLSTDAKILDAGCGSGRDARAFVARGYKVKAFDAAPALAMLAQEYVQLPVEVLRFEDLAYEAEFHGIWACASLLHVPMLELPSVLRRLTRALEPNGVIYASFKYGESAREKDGRIFTDLNEKRLGRLIESTRGLRAIETWVSRDRRSDRSGERWLNTLLMAEPQRGT